MVEPFSKGTRAASILRGLWDADPTPVCFMDEEYNLAYRNPAFDRLVQAHWHLAADTLEGRSVLTSLPLPAPVHMALVDLKTDPRPTRLSQVQLGPTEAFWDVRIQPYQEAGALIGAALHFDDRTDAVRREREEQERRRLLAAVLEATPEALLWVTADGLVQLQNEAAAAFGEAPVGSQRPLASLLGGGAWLLPDGTPLAQGASPFEAAIAGRSLAPTHLVLRRPGQADRLFRASVTPVLPIQGQAPAALLMLLDLSAVARPAEPSSGFLDAIVGHLADGVMVVTPDGKLRLVNEAAQRLLQLPPHASLTSLEKFDVRALDDRSLSKGEMPIAKVLQGERVSEVVLKLVADDGHEVVLATSGSPILDEREGVQMGVIVFHDVTEEFRLRQALTEKVRELEAAVASLKEIDRLKTNFLNTISHELRTPLTNIIGFVELIEDQVLGPLSTPQLETIGLVMESARHLLTLINDLLDFTQLEAGRIAFSFMPVDLTALTQQVVPAVRTKSGKDLAVTITEDPGTLRARADHNRVIQVLENLLDNAFKFTPLGGRVNVHVGPDGPGLVRLEIADTGIGIPPEAQEHLFSKFFQVESGLRREQGGTGLGLAICKMLIEKQGGTIGLSSEPNVGTRVWFTLPVWDEDARTSPSAAS